MHPCPKNKIKNHDWKLENIKRNVLLKRNSRNNRIQKTEKNLPNNQIKNSVGWCNVISGIVKERISRLKDRSKEKFQHEAQVNKKMEYTEEQRQRQYNKKD